MWVCFCSQYPSAIRQNVLKITCRPCWAGTELRQTDTHMTTMTERRVLCGVYQAVEAAEAARDMADLRVPPPLPTPRADIANRPQHSCRGWNGLRNRSQHSIPGSHYQLTGAGTGDEAYVPVLS